MGVCTWSYAIRLQNYGDHLKNCSLLRKFFVKKDKMWLKQ